MAAPDIQLFRHISAAARWEMARRAAHPALSAYVREYVGYDETTAMPMRRVEAPHDATVLILNFGPPLVIEGPDGARRSSAAYASFFAGLHDAHVATETCGSQRGLQINLTPLGAYRLLRAPLDGFANRVAGLEHALGKSADRLVSRLQETPDWAARFALVDSFLLHRISAGAPAAPEVAHAWRRLKASGGNARIGALAAEVDWSRRRLIERFRSQVGLTPKSAARVLRFHRATMLLARDPARGWADIAQACGYFDQAHFNRDFRALSGRTPGAYRRSLLPDAGGVSAG